MVHETNGPPPEGIQQAGQGTTERVNNIKIRPTAKWRRVLAALLEGRSFNRFQAERELFDHCLHSTIADLQAKSLTIHRREETVRGYMGVPTRVCRYWLASESRERAQELLGVTTTPQEGLGGVNAPVIGS